MGCLAEDTVYRFVRGELSIDQARGVDEHMADCEDCRGLVADSAKALLPAETSVESLAETAETWMEKPPSGAAPAAALDPGQRVGRYVIMEVVGRGGMGIVYAAHDPGLNRTITLKLL